MPVNSRIASCNRGETLHHMEENLASIQENYLADFCHLIDTLNK